MYGVVWDEIKQLTNAAGNTIMNTSNKHTEGIMNACQWIMTGLAVAGMSGPVYVLVKYWLFMQEEKNNATHTQSIKL